MRHSVISCGTSARLTANWWVNGEESRGCQIWKRARPQELAPRCFIGGRAEIGGARPSTPSPTVGRRRRRRKSLKTTSLPQQVSARVSSPVIVSFRFLGNGRSHTHDYKKHRRRVPLDRCVVVLAFVFLPVLNSGVCMAWASLAGCQVKCLGNVSSQSLHIWNTPISREIGVKAQWDTVPMCLMSMRQEDDCEVRSSKPGLCSLFMLALLDRDMTAHRWTSIS